MSIASRKSVDFALPKVGCYILNRDDCSDVVLEQGAVGRGVIAMSRPLLVSTIVSICVLAHMPTWAIQGNRVATKEIVDTVNAAALNIAIPLLLRTVDDDGRIKDSTNDSLFRLPENP